MSHKHCSLCDKICSGNKADELRANHAAHTITEPAVSRATYVCEACLSARSYARCCKTGETFLAKENQSQVFLRSKMRHNMAPHHPSTNLYGPLSPRGLELISREHDAIQSLIRNWAGATKREELRGYKIVREIGVVREDGEYNDTAEVEEALKWQTAQRGGNGYIRFVWDKHIRPCEEEYVAGYGHKGNPYYRTRRWTETYFTGHAVAVLAEHPNAKSHRNQSSQEQPRRYTESDYVQLLGLKGKVTREDIKAAYRTIILQYHPDKCAHLGPELRKVAEQQSKLINEAYEFLRKKYGF